MTRSRAAQEPPITQCEEPPITQYELDRLEIIKENNRRLQELGIFQLASDVNKICIEASSSKRKKSGNNCSHDEGSDSSEYNPEDEEEGGQGGDSDGSNLGEEPIPINVSAREPRRTYTKKTARKCTKKSGTMPPGSTRASKRVRASGPTELPLAVSTRSTKRQHRPEPEHEDVGDFPFTEMDWTQHEEEDATQPQLGDNGEDSEQQTQSVDGAEPRPRRKPRPQTKGTMLDRITRATGRRLPIEVAEGMRRPEKPVQAAKLASESSIVIRSHVPILTHWKKYEKQPHFDRFMGKLAIKLAVGKTNVPIKDACENAFQSGIRQRRYRLKKQYFDGVPANQVTTTSPVKCMSDEQWRELVAKWSDAKNKLISEKNKLNRSKVKHHQTTGSRSYVAHLHCIRENKKGEQLDEELDAVEAFKECHNSKRKGMSDSVKEAISTMESMMAEPIEDGETPRSSTEVVSKVLSQTSGNSTFLKNAGLQTSTNKPTSSTERALREELAAEKQGKAQLREEVDVLKNKIEVAEEEHAKTRREFEEFKKRQDANELLLQRILAISSANANT